MFDPSGTQTSICPAMLPTEASLASTGYAQRARFEYETELGHEATEADGVRTEREASLVLRLLQATCGGFTRLYQRTRVAADAAMEELAAPGRAMDAIGQSGEESGDPVISKAA